MSEHARSFFRIVSNDPPQLYDFRSHEELGRTLIDPTKDEEWKGISVYGSLYQAMKKAKDYPTLGRLIAELTIPSASGVTYERTGRGSSHYTLQGSRGEMLACVVAIHQVGGEDAAGL